MVFTNTLANKNKHTFLINANLKKICQLQTKLVHKLQNKLRTRINHKNISLYIIPGIKKRYIKKQIKKVY